MGLVGRFKFSLADEEIQKTIELTFWVLNDLQIYDIKICLFNFSNPKT